LPDFIFLKINQGFHSYVPQIFLVILFRVFYLCVNIHPRLFSHSKVFLNEKKKQVMKKEYQLATVVVRQGLFGKQEAFFKTVQELSARNVTKLLKELHGDRMDIIDVMSTLRDQ